MTDPVSSRSIEYTIEKLRALTQIPVQNQWRCCPQDIPANLATQWKSCQDWPIAELNSKGYIVWSAGQQVMWLSQKFVIPHNLQGYPLAGLSLRLALTWWAQLAQIFVNGQLVQEGDLFDSSTRILLSESVQPNEEISVALRLISPGHDIGALMRSICLYESVNGIDPGFVADELAILHQYLETFEPEKLEHLAIAIAEIDWEGISHPEKFEQSLSQLRHTLQSTINNQQSTIHLLGHAHLDLAWLWTVSETWEVAQRTFESVLNLQQEFPDLTYCHSTPALYAWIEQHRPDLFSAIQQQIAAGRWEVVGGMWVEPELNLINGESIVRQILYAQRYVQEKFGELTRVAWVPDSFGFCWQLPQILKQGGIEYFVTQKLHWNDTTKFPYGVFWWRSPDGTPIFSLMSPPNTTGVMDTNPLTMAAYAIAWQTQTHLKDVFWLPGVGDHGGGPTRDMLKVQERWQNSPFFPNLEFTTAQSYLQHIRLLLTKRVRDGQDAHPTEDIFACGVGVSPAPELDKSAQEFDEKDSYKRFIKEQLETEIPKNAPSQIQNPIPVWNDELYLEFHRGCYTTHADQKRWNRRCEDILYQAELFASVANLTTGLTYPKFQLENAWKKVLFNQFHDILPGTSIPEVFVEANKAWQEVEQVGLKILEESLDAIANCIALPSPPHPDAQPIIVFNPLNWQRSEVVTVSVAGITNEQPQGIASTVNLSQQPFLSNSGAGLSNSGAGLSNSGAGLSNSGAGLSNSGAGLSNSGAGETPTPQAKMSSVGWASCPSSDIVARGLVSWDIYDLSGQKLPSQFTEESTLLFLAQDIPSIGYRVFWLCPTSIPHSPFHLSNSPNDWTLENEFLRVVVDPNTGDLSSVFDKILSREILSSPGNQLQTFQDKGQYWDAWNIDPNYNQYPLPATELKSIEWLERGAVRSRLRVVRELGQSQFCQDYILDTQSPVLKIATTVDWQERHVLVKAAFPLSLEANYATYETACAAIQRPTQLQTPAEQAKWEVPALRWADLTDNSLTPNEYGVSLLNDCKYGYDAQPSQLRLTLLRSPHWPDPEADRGIHHFTYALYPHSGSWQSASTVQRGYELNLPLIVFNPPVLRTCSPKPLQPTGRFLELEASNLILMAFKPSEDASELKIDAGTRGRGDAETMNVVGINATGYEQWILRCYECQGESAEFCLRSDLDLAIAHPVDLLEQPTVTPELLPDGQSFTVSPWKIVSVALRGTLSHQVG
jgi:alpha-mannosidase